MGPALKVLVVDDSLVVQKSLGKSLSGLENLEAIDYACNGVEMLNKISIFQPDVVICDLRMPYLDGIDAVAKLQQELKKPPIPIIFFSANFDDQQIGSKLSGYLHYDWVRTVNKPKGLHYDGVAQELRDLCLTLSQRFPQHYRKLEENQKIEIICLGASAGGPDALCELFHVMGKVSLPILILQHNTPGYSRNFKEWLKGCTQMPIQVVEQRQDIHAGVIYLPLDNHHLWVSPDRKLNLRKNSEQDRFCPSINLTLSSVASAYGASTMGVLLSGMGDDGVEGLRDIFNYKGVTIVQNQASCKVFGMPKSALRQNIVQMTLSPEEIGLWIKRIAQVD
ncbi:hypothetical protein COW36_21785 [bacterium (Candidatus Blackallbacteria) CG17_big_fil_post_rev_8_21_14_2_50_48_46]|uniref:protein-glutamate methylesterase n=1 Tax=bacterium (Candidatus Blackallbacteria) CG17_big_fil_post_rev_8_21_14_2_50_48_46 TaxID=2014261 RepID=A0A2M7FYU4_9BACT|nr:MAG: hypothetical protein COW64_11075 [bacterium (Candidatus Blackallbacteria) CG18_big_fil_WC_8_21_14_2_50_49_26]PIW14401.1 MAG: hypothetical protein COW36_21785 [bacterium (Candidatus Blackallbacteria) CG17_big_fil_post_rev_8_21_14_2_50_48_46]PIW46908.1 MAG: hypothetical protein COW20_14200 [bacterium (Candidatus Blackallbacteria) CG13_big_fil_rev_8_21_14_2_50_49_14]